MKNAFFCGLFFHFAVFALMAADTYQINFGFFYQTTELLILQVIGWLLMLPYGCKLVDAGSRKIYLLVSRAAPEKRVKPH